MYAVKKESETVGDDQSDSWMAVRFIEIQLCYIQLLKVKVANWI